MKYLRSPIRKYLTALALFGVAIALTYLFHHINGPSFTVYLVIYLVTIMASAWCGYGPGMLVTILTLVLVPYLFSPTFSLAHFDFSRAVLALLVSALISRVAEGHARIEDALRKSNEELDKKVRLRTEDLERANAALIESEHRFSRFMRHLPGAAWMKDLQGRYVYANPTGERIFHRPLDQLRGRTDSEIFPSEVARQFQDNDQKVLNGNQGLQTIETLPHEDGIHYSVVSKFPIRDTDGKPIMVGGIAIDITEQRKAEQESNDRLAELEGLYKAAPVGLGLVDDQLRYVRVNEQLAAINGLPAADHIGRTIRDVLTPELADAVEPLYRQVFETGQPVLGREVHGVLIARPEVEGDWLVSYSPVKTEDGRILGVQILVQDITEQKRFDEHLHHTAKLESLGLLAGGVAHDFNNLLVGILGNASLALDSLSPGSAIRPFLQDVITASERAAQLTRQMLAYSGKGRFIVQAVDIGELIGQTAPLMKAALSGRVELRIEAAAGLAPVEIDVSQIEQLIMNLVINGAEAIPEGQTGIVTVSVFEQSVDEAFLRASVAKQRLEEGLYVCVEVCDTGAGMDENTKARIFDPFFTTKFTGRGLGLAAALGIVRGHKGSIEVHSKPGEGSTFRILLPAAAAGKALGPEIPQRISTDLAGAEAILVVDDEHTVRQMAQQALRRFGYTTLLAHDGEAAIEIFSKHAADIHLVLLDMTMPSMSGEQTLSELRKIRPDIPVLLSSGYSEAEVERRFQGRQLSGFLQKPYTASELASAIRSAMDNSAAANHG